jgi:hypothetical protein
MHAPPIQGVSKSKPRFKTAKEELPELSREYLTIRNQQMRTKNLAAEMQLAERRGELIEKSLVERQAAYLLVALRQAILNVPQTWCRRLIGLNDAAQVSKILREMALSLLGEIKDLPAKVTNPDWLDEEIEEDTKSKRGKEGRSPLLATKLSPTFCHGQLGCALPARTNSRRATLRIL